MASLTVRLQDRNRPISYRKLSMRRHHGNEDQEQPAKQTLVHASTTHIRFRNRKAKMLKTVHLF
jgi:hypothetical protein